MGLIVRAAEERDVPAIRDIYNHEVLHGTATFDIEPKTLEDRLQWFRQTNQAPYCVIVAKHASEVVGWGCLHPFGGKPGYRYTTEDSVYVRADSRGSGVGKALLGALIEMGGANGFHTIVARIAGDNPASVRLHQLLGFEHVGREREVGRKFDRWLDVVVMQRMLA